MKLVCGILLCWIPERTGGLMMTFRERLNDYMKEIGLTSRELANLSNTSEAVISRYRSGKRLPKPDGDTTYVLSHALSLAAQKKGLDTSENGPYSVASIQNSLLSTLPNAGIDKKDFLSKLNALISSLNISISRFSKYSSYDPSFVSRIIKGERSPSDYVLFARNVGDFCASAYHADSDLEVISALLDVDKKALSGSGHLSAKIVSYLLNQSTDPSEDARTGNDGSDTIESKTTEKFLSQIDSFDLNAYMNLIHFDKINLPSIPFRLGSNKSYTGLKGMKSAELDFLRSVAFSADKSPVYMYSTLPMTTMDEDKDYYRKYMFYLAVIIKKGHDIHIIHHLDRPDDEILTGLMGWIPIYMTGKVHSYYFPGESDPVFKHFLRFSDNIASMGECIGNDIENALIKTTKVPGELKIHRKRALELFGQASLLMNTYRSENALAYREFLTKELSAISEESECIRLLSAPSLYTLSSSMSDDISSFYDFSESDAEMFRSALDFQTDLVHQFFQKGGRMEEYLYTPNESGFTEHPAYLALSGAFIDKNIAYPFDRYMKHVEKERRFSSETPGMTCHVLDGDKYSFRNIQITILKGKWAMISKNTAPAIHFVIHHPKLVNAITELL